MRPNVVILGEAPGKEENDHGRPFIGRSGKLLQTILNTVASSFPEKFRYLISNTVACAPWRDTGKIGTPTEEEATACRPWVFKLLRLTQPELVINLGSVARESYEMYLLPLFDYPYISVYHPAYLLRTGGTLSPHYPRVVREISEAVEVHCGVEKGKTQ